MVIHFVTVDSCELFVYQEHSFILNCTHYMKAYGYMKFTLIKHIFTYMQDYLYKCLYI